MGFRALGLDTYPVTSADEAREKVRELAKTSCAVIYLTEQLAKEMDDVLARYKDELRPAIILIPGREGSLGIGKNNIQWVPIFCKPSKGGLRPPWTFRRAASLLR